MESVRDFVRSESARNALTLHDSSIIDSPEGSRLLVEYRVSGQVVESAQSALERIADAIRARHGGVVVSVQRKSISKKSGNYHLLLLTASKLRG